MFSFSVVFFSFSSQTLSLAFLHFCLSLSRSLFHFPSFPPSPIPASGFRMVQCVCVCVGPCRCSWYIMQLHLLASKKNASIRRKVRERQEKMSGLGRGGCGVGSICQHAVSGFFCSAASKPHVSHIRQCPCNLCSDALKAFQIRAGCFRSLHSGLSL